MHRDSPALLAALSPRQEPAEPAADVRPIIGPLFLGACFTWMLLGTLVVQIYWYNCRYPNDRLALKVLVYSLLFIDVLQTCLTTWFTWDYVILSWGNLLALQFPPTTVITLPFFSSFVGMTVQTFYAWRIWTVGRLRYFRLISIVIVVIAIIQFIACCIGLFWFAVLDDAKLLHRLRAFFVVWLVGSFICDALIAGSMLHIFYKAKMRSRALTSSAASIVESLLDRLIRQAVESGAITAICTGVELGLFVANDSVNIHIAPAYVLGKLYSNCLLAMLNSRTPVQGWGAISTIPEGGHFSSINQKPRSQTDAYAYKMDGVSTSNSARKLTGSIPGGNGDDENDVRYGDVDRSNTVLRIQVERETTSDAVQHKANKRRDHEDVADMKTRASSETDLESFSSRKDARGL